jgi:hypothetical protein
MSRGGVALASECGQLGDAPVLAVSVEKAKEAAFNRLVLTQLGDLGFQEFGVLSREGETFYLQRSRPAAKPSAESPLKPPSKPVTEEFPKKPPAAPSAATGAVPTYKQGYDDSLAVVIGIDKYANWSPLAYAVSDAESIREHLRSTGFNTISFLVDEQATKTNIITALGDLLKVKAKANDRVVVFFAGHGYTEISSDGTRSGFIVPADGASSDPSTFISLDRLGELARNIPAKHVFFLMDSCFSGGLVRFRGEIGPAPRFTAEMSVKDVLAKTRFPVRQVLTCGGEGERVMEKSGHGICTKVIADGLAGEADLNGDGYVVANELSRFAAVRVQEISGGLQNPQFGYLEQKSPVLGEMVLKFAN